MEINANSVGGRVYAVGVWSEGSEVTVGEDDMTERETGVLSPFLFVADSQADAEAKALARVEQVRPSALGWKHLAAARPYDLEVNVGIGVTPVRPGG